MLYKIFAVLTAMKYVMSAAPGWTTPTDGATFTLDATDNTACDQVTEIYASSGDGTTVFYSVSAQTPAGDFTTDLSQNTGNYILKCNLATIKASTATSYSVTLRASNSGVNADRTITITVTGLSPQNVNAPVFSGTPYNLKVCRDKINCLDDISLPYMLFGLIVTDADNNTVTLSLPDADPAIFTTENHTVKVKGSLVSLSSPYELKVVATDNGTPSKSSSATVTLTLGYAPKFTDPSNSSDVIYLCETSIGGDELIKLQASDTDTPIANLVFSMDNSPTQTKNLFEIVGDTLKVISSVPNGTFDYEKLNAVLQYNISLKVSDGTFNSILNTQIVLEDFNDNPPVFLNTPYTKSIPEATTPGSSVFQVSATDADKTSPNNVVTFTLSGSNDFTINNTSGVISVAAGVTLNYGTTPSYSLTVIALDGGGIDNLTASALVTLKISTKPTFDNLALARSVSVDENVPVGTSVFTLTVTDRDNTGPLSFFIKTESVTGAFLLNGTILQTAKSIDKETLSSYTISFNVTDGTYTVDSALLTINVNDVNEMPTISAPNSPVKLLEPTVAGTAVFNVSASDPDMSAPNNAITFSMAGSGSSDFSIMNSGVVLVASGVTLDYTRQASYQLVITAKDGGTPSLSSSSTVTVSILAKPTFDNLGSPNTALVDENVPIGTSVFTVTVSDRDSSSGVLNVSIKSQSTNGAFVLNGTILQTATNIDRETLSSYTISFSVTDGTYNVDSALLTVNVNDVNEKPTISVPNIPVKLLETTAAGTQVFNVSASDPDMSAPNNVITFSLSGSGSSDFSIGAGTGVVSVASGVTLDYTRQASYQLVITAKDGGTPSLSSSSTVTVNLLTKPTFDTLTSPQSTSVNENVPIGTLVFTVAVSDKDNSGGTLQPVIKSQSVNGAFVLNGSVLQTAINIDKETKDSYTISFNVTDGTFPVDSALLTINVNDVNEKPTISVPNSPVQLLESTVAGTQVFNVSASDPDMSAPNNVITFSLSGSGSSDFSIGASTGVVSVVTLNYTRQPSYQLVITAKDGGTPSLSSSSTVTVSILTKPIFDTFTSPISTSVNENVPIGTSVFTVAVSDKDNSGGTLQPVIKSQSVNGAFVLNGSVLQTAINIDKETKDSYTISFNVTDGTFPVDSALLTINVNDVNEKPTISVPNSPVQLLETTVAGTQVFNVSASDPDMSAPNNVITFSLSGSGSSDFSIGASTGVVSVVTLNYTRQPSYQLVITAKDGGTPSLSSSSTVTVSILTKPIFDTLTSPISTSVNENVPIGTSVFTVAVSDKDNSGGTLQPVIKSQSVNGAFVLNGSVLQTTINIDRETKDSYTISFSVTDGTYSVDSALLTITVNDVNEKPTISVPNSPVKLLESTVTGTHVFNVSASDPDMSAPNNVITFSLSGSGSSDFSISSNTGSAGVVSVASGVTLNYTRQPSYQLIITAKDGGTPSLSSSSTVTVNIITKPTFNNLGSPSTASVNENVPIGTSVFTVTVSDKDNSSGGTLQPVIKDQSTNGAFVLNGTILQTATNIDREALSSYTITFSVTDGTYTVDSAVLTVNVNDINEKPTISVPNSPVKILETTVAGTQVFNVSASDPDMSAPNNVITFGFLGSSDFSIMNSGVVSVATGKTLNYTRQQSYELVMIATDGGTPPLSSSSTVTVSILTKPTFDTLTSPINILIDENIQIGTSVFTVSVSDKDNSSGTLQPVIKSQSENGAFVLNGRILQTAKKIDRETLGSYTISFNVTDGTFTTESATLSITVSDLNDNPPLINPLPDIIKIGKNKEAGKVVLYIRADDADATPANNVLTYSIIDGNGNGYFSINQSSGSFELVKYPDSADTKTQSFKVKVVDGGTPQLSASVNFSVEFSKSLIEHEVTMTVNGTCPDLTNPSEYKRIENSIKKMLRDELKIEGVIVFNIRCGSISFDSTILINDTESEKTALAERLQQIESGKTLSLDSENVTAKNITVNENTISQNASVCEVFITINPCGPDHQCSYEKGTASCKLEKPLNTDLIIGLCIGLILPLLAVLIMLIVAVVCRRRRRHKSKKSSSLNGSTKPRRDKFRGHRWQGDFHMPAMMGYTNHAFTNGVKDGPTRAGQSKRDYYGISAI